MQEMLADAPLDQTAAFDDPRHVHLVLEVLITASAGSKLHVFQSCPIEHQVVWKLADDLCTAVSRRHLGYARERRTARVPARTRCRRRAPHFGRVKAA